MNFSFIELLVFLAAIVVIILILGFLCEWAEGKH